MPRKPPVTATAVRNPDEKLTIAEICAELKIARSTFNEWRAKGRAPRCITLPNRAVRIRRADFERWLAACQESA